MTCTCCQSKDEHARKRDYAGRLSAWVSEDPRRQDALDGVVHDAYSSMASAVNNGGPEVQINTLILEHGWSPVGIGQLLDFYPEGD